MELKQLIILDNVGNIIKGIETNNPTLQFSDDEIVIDITNNLNSLRIVNQPDKYKAVLTQDGTYAIVLK